MRSLDQRLRRLEAHAPVGHAQGAAWQRVPVALWRADDFHAWYRHLVATGDPEGLIARAEHVAATTEAALLGTPYVAP